MSVRIRHITAQWWNASGCVPLNCIHRGAASPAQKTQTLSSAHWWNISSFYSTLTSEHWSSFQSKHMWNKSEMEEIQDFAAQMRRECRFWDTAEFKWMLCEIWTKGPLSRLKWVLGVYWQFASDRENSTNSALPFSSLYKVHLSALCVE